MLSQAYITGVKLTSKGDVIVSTLNGLNVYNRDTDTFTYIRQNNEMPDKSLNCNFINCLLTDNENIWVGTGDRRNQFIDSQLSANVCVAI